MYRVVCEYFIWRNYDLHFHITILLKTIGLNCFFNCFLVLLFRKCIVFTTYMLFILAVNMTIHLFKEQDSKCMNPVRIFSYQSIEILVYLLHPILYFL